MMRIWRWVLLTGVVSALAWAADPATPAPATHDKVAHPRVAQAQTTATLSAVDAAKQTITLARHNATEVYRVNEQTAFVINGEKGDLTGLKADQKVRVHYLKTGEPPYTAVRIEDAQTIAIVDAEHDGVSATIDKVETRGEGAKQTTVVVVTTAQGKQRELVLRPQSVLMKAGQPAKLEDFKAGDAVTVSVRRTSGETLFLSEMGDTSTYAAFLADRTLRGKLTAISADKRRLTLEVAGEAKPATVELTKATTYFKGGKAADALPFEVGEELVVKFRDRSEGVAFARAIFAPDSWQAYADSLKAPVK